MISPTALEQQLKHLPPGTIEVILEVHNIVAGVCPDAVERIDRKGISYYDAKRGGPVKAGICQLLFDGNELRLAFIHGACLPDPGHLLHGDTYPKRSMQLTTYDEIPWEAVTRLISASAAFDPMILPQNQKTN